MKAWLTHGSMAIAGAAMVAAGMHVSSSRVSGGSGALSLETSTVNASHADRSREASVSDRELLEALADQPLSYRVRESMRDRLEAKWIEDDAEGFLRWRTRRPWLRRGATENASEALASQNPEALYRIAREQGDGGMIYYLTSVNPRAALGLYRSTPEGGEVFNLEDLFSGVRTDPSLADELGTIDDPEAKHAAFMGVAEHLARSGQFEASLAIWAKHREILTTYDLALGLETLEAQCRGGGAALLAAVGLEAKGDDVQVWSDPLLSLQLLDRMQGRFLADDSVDTWSGLLTDSDSLIPADKASQEAEQLRQLARGELDGDDRKAALAVLAQGWMGATPEDVIRQQDPDFRDAFVKQMLEQGTWGRSLGIRSPREILTELVAAISDPVLHAKAAAWMERSADQEVIDPFREGGPVEDDGEASPGDH
jgi:hypothetical protein